MSDFDSIIYPIPDSVVKRMTDEITKIKRRTCDETGLSEDEVKIEIDQNGAIRAICRPRAKIAHICIEMSLEQEKNQ